MKGFVKERLRRLGDSDPSGKRRFSFPNMKEIERVVASLSPFEKVVFWLLVAVFTLSSLTLLVRANDSVLVEIEARGGSFSEGVVGSPRFINPVLALSDADRDLSALVYSGLMKATPEGEVVPDLAESYTVSEDGLVYEFTLREDVRFHDGTPVTTKDVIFTINKTLDPTLKSAQRANWDGVRVEQVDERVIRFTLARPYAPFLQNATMGILPEHIWGEIDSGQFPFSNANIDPIGSGPYKVRSVKKNSSGIPEVYTLSSFNNYALGEPYIKKLTLHFYQNENELISAFNKGAVDAVHGLTPERVSELKAERTLQVPLSRVFGVFFNQNRAQIFSHIEVRKALDVAVDKEALVDAVLAGYGRPINGPIPPESIGSEAGAAMATSTDRVMEAQAILERNGWERDEESGVWMSSKDEPLRFSIATSNVNELKTAAAVLERTWEAVGAEVEVQIFEAGNLNQNIIRPREYDALLFGEVIGRELDLFAFWHSSQRNDPGLNIALYANITADALLEKGRTELDTDERNAAYLEFEKEVQKDTPAVFLYSPDFVYVLPEHIQGISLSSVETSADRFLDVHEWYIRTDKVWSIFSN